jgi:hypothetical protein
MLIQTLRNLITVHNWGLTKISANISYTRKDKRQTLHFIAAPIDVMRGLSRNAVIDDYNENTGEVMYNDKAYDWDAFCREYHLSQWDALCLAIDHELELAQTIEGQELDEMFKNLL